MNNNHENTLSKEEVAIVNATFKLYEIVILHRIYKRAGGKHQFTKGALASARNALLALRPSVPGTNPVRIVAVLAESKDLAKASTLYAIEEAQKAKRELWDRIRRIELSDAELKNLTGEAPIFRLYRSAADLERTTGDLSHGFVVPRVAHLAWCLADKISGEWEERNPLPTMVEAA